MSSWKGIILAGGSGTRLAPLTTAISKQLLPVYDKPMIYYPLSTLIQIGIREIAIITTPDQQHLFKKLLSDGSQLGCHFEFFIQEKPTGLAEAFLITEEFIKDSPTCLILGDNIFYGNGLVDLAKEAMSSPAGAVIKIAKSLTPSKRGELEITDINKTYLSEGSLRVKVIERGVAWLDAGTFESLLQAGSFIHAVQERQGLMVGSPEEAAWLNKLINNERLKELAEPHKKNAYGRYLLNLVGNKNANN